MPPPPHHHPSIPQLRSPAIAHLVLGSELCVVERWGAGCWAARGGGNCCVLLLVEGQEDAGRVMRDAGRGCSFCCSSRCCRVGSSPPPALSCSAALGSPRPCARSYVRNGLGEQRLFSFLFFFFIKELCTPFWPLAHPAGKKPSHPTACRPSQAAVPRARQWSCGVLAQQDAVGSVLGWMEVCGAAQRCWVSGSPGMAEYGCFCFYS